MSVLLACKLSTLAGSDNNEPFISSNKGCFQNYDTLIMSATSLYRHNDY